MRIAAVRTHVLGAPPSEPFRWSFSEAPKRETLLVEIATDEGPTG